MGGRLDGVLLGGTMTDTHDSTRARVGRIARQRLESLQRAGLTHVPKPPPGDCPDFRASENGTVPLAPSTPCDAAVAEPIASSPTAPSTDAGAEATLARLAARVATCTRCAELAQARTQTVFGAGNPRARLVFLGEAPGADEDRQGVPFVGRAGQLLTRIIEACTLRRENVYILNILKCRPPGNRNPLPDEAANCREYLDAQLAAIQPEFICCLGAVAAKNLLETDAGISKMRGKFYLYNGIRVLCTYHPAYLLRNPPAKRQVWEDMQFLMAEMGIELPRSRE
ncbi:MAG: uracil-DNA glycosylase [Pirellulales bacterium]|nr:uracil-DNA glycosylase [Pirellulales bacterium]